MRLPPFPQFTEEFELPSVIPIPRLLPSYEWVQGLKHGDASGRTAALSNPAVLGAGFVMGAVLTLVGAGAVYLYQGATHMRKGRLQMRQKLELAQSKASAQCGMASI